MMISRPKHQASPARNEPQAPSRYHEADMGCFASAKALSGKFLFSSFLYMFGHLL
jgi:hypothetical protein